MRVLLRSWIAVLVVLGAIGGGSGMGMAAQESEATPMASPDSVDLPKFSIRPVGDFDEEWFELTAEAGETVPLTARVLNFGDVDAKLRTYAANATNPANGGFSAGTDDDEPTGPTHWLDFPAETLELAPGDERLIDFTVSIPADTPAGDYVAALAVQTAEPLGIPGTTVFEQIIRSTISVEITVPGEMTSGIELGEPAFSAAGDQWALDIPVTNTGTARVRPQGELVVTTPSGDVVSTSQVEMGSVYGGNTTSVRVVLPGQVPFGDYLVSLALTDESTGASDSIQDAPVTLAEPVVEEKLPFVVEESSVTPNAELVQYADVAAVITNNGPAIPTANVTLNVQRDGEGVESYLLAENQALPQGTTDFSQRYIPGDGWQAGTYSFELVISAVSGNTETVIATVEIPDEIAVP